MERRISRTSASVILSGIAVAGVLAIIGLTRTASASDPAWAAGTSYAVGARVTYNSADYQCIQAHTAQIGWEPPKVPALWLRPQPGDCQNWQSQTSYALGALATYNGVLYKALQAHTSQAGWEPTNAPALWAQSPNSACFLEAKEYCCTGTVTFVDNDSKKAVTSGQDCKATSDSAADQNACVNGTMMGGGKGRSFGCQDSAVFTPTNNNNGNVTNCH